MNVTITKTPTTRRAELYPIPCSACGGTGFAPVTAVAHVPVAEPAPVEYVGLPDTGPVRLPIAQALRVLLEAIDGLRPVEQLARVATAPVVRHVRAARACQRGATVTRLRSVRLCRPTEDVAEVAAVVGFDGRVRAAAARFERTSAGWCCTALNIL